MLISPRFSRLWKWYLLFDFCFSTLTEGNNVFRSQEDRIDDSPKLSLSSLAPTSPSGSPLFNRNHYWTRARHQWIPFTHSKWRMIRESESFIPLIYAKIITAFDMTICTRVKNRTDHHWFKMVKDQMLTWNRPIQIRKNLPDLKLLSPLTKSNIHS